MMRKELLVVIACLAPAALFAPACGTDAIGVDACRRIEESRCKRGPGCGLDMSLPVHTDDDVTACIRHYREACLHGLERTENPSPTDVQQCVKAIDETTDCAVVRAPQNAPACAWLVPAPTPQPEAAAPEVDAGAPADAGDGG
jgi:hypothetical protein